MHTKNAHSFFIKQARDDLEQWKKEYKYQTGGYYFGSYKSNEEERLAGEIEEILNNIPTSNTEQQTINKQGKKLKNAYINAWERLDQLKPDGSKNGHTNILKNILSITICKVIVNLTYDSEKGVSTTGILKSISNLTQAFKMIGQKLTKTEGQIDNLSGEIENLNVTVGKVQQHLDKIENNVNSNSGFFQTINNLSSKYKISLAIAGLAITAFIGYQLYQMGRAKGKEETLDIEEKINNINNTISGLNVK